MKPDENDRYYIEWSSGEPCNASPNSGIEDLVIYSAKPSISDEESHDRDATQASEINERDRAEGSR